MELSQGGATSALSKSKPRIESIRVSHDSNDRVLNLFINEDSLSYITLEEALALRDELNNAITSAVNLTIKK